MSNLIKVKEATLKLIYDSLLPVRTKMSLVLEDIYSKSIPISDPHLALLLEFSSHALTLKIILEEYFEKASESGEIHIPKEDFSFIVNIAKSVELATRTDFGNITFWNN